MTFVTQDEVAQAVLGVAGWSSMSAVDQYLLEPIFTGVEAAIAVHLGLNTSRTTREEILALHHTFPKHSLEVDETRWGTDLIYLKHTPVTVSGLTVYAHESEEPSSWTSNEELTAGTDFQLEDVVSISLDGTPTDMSMTGALRRLGGSTWPVRPGCVRVTYTGGFDSTMLTNNWELVKMATFTCIRDHYATAKKAYGIQGAGATGPLKSESIGKYSYTIDSDGSRTLSLNGTSLGGLTTSARAILSPLVDYGIYF